jgi:hypothetical protein
MIKSVSQLYRRHKTLFLLSAWKPPGGVVKALTFHQCGCIEVTLSCGLYHEDGFWLQPGEELSPDAFRRLDAMAARLLGAAPPRPTGPDGDPLAEAELRMMSAIWDVEKRHGHD